MLSVTGSSDTIPVSHFYDTGVHCLLTYLNLADQLLLTQMPKPIQSFNVLASDDILLTLHSSYHFRIYLLHSLENLDSQGSASVSLAAEGGTGGG